MSAKGFSVLRSSNNLLSSHSGAKLPGSCRERKRNEATQRETRRFLKSTEADL